MVFIYITISFVVDGHVNSLFFVFLLFTSHNEDHFLSSSSKLPWIFFCKLLSWTMWNVYVACTNVSRRVAFFIDGFNWNDRINFTSNHWHRLHWAGSTRDLHNVHVSFRFAICLYFFFFEKIQGERKLKRFRKWFVISSRAKLIYTNLSVKVVSIVHFSRRRKKDRAQRKKSKERNTQCTALSEFQFYALRNKVQFNAVFIIKLLCLSEHLSLCVYMNFFSSSVALLSCSLSYIWCYVKHLKLIDSIVDCISHP